MARAIDETLSYLIHGRKSNEERIQSDKLVSAILLDRNLVLLTSWADKRTMAASREPILPSKSHNSFTYSEDSCFNNVRTSTSMVTTTQRPKSFEAHHYSKHVCDKKRA